MKVISTIFNHYPAFINMVSSISCITVPSRFIKQAKLLAAFNMKSICTSSKGKGKAASDESEDGKYIPNDNDNDDNDDKLNSNNDDDEKEADANAAQPKQSRDQCAVLRQKHKDEYSNHVNSLKCEI
ncbi:hypothetical protein EDD15DRAFT_2361208 [Pisolithus albus]|nr:hypothetical protein EDD15DRAFT_2361208 [Pisolithus albus]